MTVAGQPAASYGADLGLRVFRLPSEPVERAVLRFGVQADVSVGWSAGAVCQGDSRPVAGVLRPAKALSRMLPPGCAFEQPDRRSFRITSRSEGAAASASSSHAAPPAPAASQAATPVLLQELVVTAEKRPEPLIASPYPIAAVAGPDLARLGGDDFQSLAGQFVGVSVTNLGPGRNKIFVRGLSDGSFTGKTQSTVGLYLNEAPITYNAPDPDLRLVDVDRVEVLRGPQGSLYGSGSIGGIIRIVTAAPDPTRRAAMVAVEGAVTDDGASSGAVEAMLNAPLARPDSAVRIVAYRETAGGYLDNVRVGLTDANRSRRSGLRIALAAPVGDWRIVLSGAHQSIATRDAQYAAGRPLIRDTAILEPHDNDFSVASLLASRATALGTLKLSANVVDHSLDTRYDASGAFGSSGVLAFDERQQVRMAMAQAELASPQDERVRWLAGLFTSASHEKETATITAPGEPGLSIYRRGDRLSEAAVFGELGLNLTPELVLTLGGRYFTSRLDTRGDRFDLAPRFRPFRARLTDGGFAPKFRMSYTAAPDRVIYLQAQEGFRAGGFNLPVVGLGMQSGETFVRRFRPDRLWNYELGGELAMFHRRLTLRAALFDSQWSNVQTDQYLASGLPITVNIGDGSNLGLEAEVAWRPDDHLQVRLNGLVEDPELTRSAGVFPARRDIGLPGVPHGMGGVDIAYRWRLASGLEATVSAQASYVGRSFVNFDGGAANRMGGYGVGRLSAQLSDGSWRLQAFLDNVANVRANTFDFGNPFSREAQSTPLRPRTVGMRVERRY